MKIENKSKEFFFEALSSVMECRAHEYVERSCEIAQSELTNFTKSPHRFEMPSFFLLVVLIFCGQSTIRQAQSTNGTKLTTHSKEDLKLLASHSKL